MGGKQKTQPKPYEVVKDIFAVGVIDTELDLFDELMPLPNGTSYNAYIVKGSNKIALIDSCEARFSKQLLQNISSLGITTVDYIISNHAEQDHSGSIPSVLNAFPNAKVVTNEKAKHMLIRALQIKEDTFQVITDKETLDLGGITLEFILAPWVHWPETMFTYVREKQTLFSCDLFGSHLAKTDIVTKKEDVMPFAKRYYAEIMMPFASFVKQHMVVLESYTIEILAPSHGPIYTKPEIIFDLHKEWLSEIVEPRVVIPYVTMHGNTKKMIDYFAKELKKKGLSVSMHDITVGDVGDIVMDCMGASTMIVASSSYLGGMHPQAAHFAYLINGFKPTIAFTSIISSHNWGSAITNEYKQFTKLVNAEFLDPVEVEGIPSNDDKKKIDDLVNIIVEKNKSFQQNEKNSEIVANPATNSASVTTKINTSSSKKITTKKPVSGNKVKITELWNETHNTKSFVLHMPETFSFKSGQHVNVSFGDGRSVNKKTMIPLSISNPPTDGNKIMLTFKEVGDFTNALSKLQIGDELIISEPFGSEFVVDEHTTDNFIFLSGGSGVTPFMSIIRFVLANGMKNKIILFNGNQTEQDIIFKEELAKINAEQENITIVTVLSKPTSTCTFDEKGFITAKIISKHVPKLDDYTFMMCGPPVMISVMQQLTEALMVPDKKILCEEWNPIGDNVEKGTCEPKQTSSLNTAVGEATLTNGTKEVKLSSGPIMKAAEELGVSFACRQGMCGACKVTVTEGMENLEPKTEKETAMNLPDGVRLCCQAKIKKGIVKIKF